MALINRLGKVIMAKAKPEGSAVVSLASCSANRVRINAPISHMSGDDRRVYIEPINNESSRSRALEERIYIQPESNKKESFVLRL